ncbi:redoxin family protein [Kribbella sp. CA-253562]|uniref:redoxin family protein n=1 Tax=Kribbella sp. CA-253562 TaxID=3239942 RepID=UPI003D8DFAA4
MIRPTTRSRLPSLGDATGWLNSQPLTSDALQGRVVLINFWTYTCINWLRQLPYLRAWASKYSDHGLLVVGVHTPEFGFEADVGNVARAVRELGIDYPVAIDSNYAVWNAFSNMYWPALYFGDADGLLRQRHFGEGKYERSEHVIQQLLSEAGQAGWSTGLVAVDAQGVESPADWASLGSPETYLGYVRTQGFTSPGGIKPDEAHDYRTPPVLGLNQWALSGNWTVTDQAATSNAVDAHIVYRFHARDLHLVMGPAQPGSPVRFRVQIDGQPPGPARGNDVDEQGYGTVTEQRLYQLVRQPGPIRDSTFELTLLDPAVEAYAMTFG